MTRPALPVHRRLRTATVAIVLLLAGSTAFPLYAQGQDSTPAERHVLIMAELLPGTWSNANQAYFGARRGLADADRHERIHTRIERVDAPAFGPHAFLWVNTVTDADGARRESHRIVTLSTGAQPDVVIMRHYLRMDGPIQPTELATLTPGDLRRTDGCDYHFRRRAGGFRGVQESGACRFTWNGVEVTTDNVIALADEELFFHDHKFRVDTGERITGVASGEPFWLERARTFHCYVDMPGVGGGRDVPFERYDDIVLHDKGGSHWFTTRENPPRRLGISLLAVTWHVLNEADGNFNRDSLVVYVSEEHADGERTEHGYGFTEPDAERIGLNLKWLLVNCARVPRDQARPAL